ncbi:MAG: translation initiation factor [Myxococcales bacterium]|nr:translation initiation factor [Myxococcales bacterium]
MGKRRPPPEPAGTTERAEPFNNPFAGLSQRVAQVAPNADGVQMPASETHPQPDSATTDDQDWSVGGKVVLRRERKGHGGKTVTVLSGMVLRGIELAAFARFLGKGLGCSARVAGDQVVMGGDQREPAAQLLLARGATRVVRS